VTDDLLVQFLDACRDGNRGVALITVRLLYNHILNGQPLPHDIRPDPKQQAEIRRLSAQLRSRNA